MKIFNRDTKVGLVVWWEINRIPLSINLLIAWIAWAEIDHIYLEIPKGSDDMQSFMFISVIMLIGFNIMLLLNWIVNIIVHQFAPAFARLYAGVGLIIAYSAPWVFVLIMLVNWEFKA